jgi:hypothetical protein
MQIIREPPAKAKVSCDGCVRISTASLTDAQAESLKQFLEQDPLVESVTLGPLQMEVSRPKRSTTPKDGNHFLTFEIQAAAEPLFLFVNLVKDNKDVFEGASAFVTMTGVTVPPVVKFVMRKIRQFYKARQTKFSKVPIYDADGHVIRWVKKRAK